MSTRLFRRVGLPALGLVLAACASLQGRDPLMVDVAGIETLPGEGMELNLAVTLRVQNPNDVPVQYDGIALVLDVNGRTLASGVSDRVGTVPRYGEIVFTVPMTISAFDVARQVYGMMNAENPERVEYRLRGKLEGGLFGTHRFTDEGTFSLSPRSRSSSH
ncbi:MAG TPA: LEA type 2 family protein [Woeseiaceae bacterium]|nr:LEA type 2 family protein [Woeseiaceae bacterium]